MNKQDVNEVSLSSTFVRQVVKQLNLRPKDLLNRAHPYYQAHVRGRDLDMEGWLHVVVRNPQLWKAPVALLGDQAVLCEPASLIYTLSRGTAEGAIGHRHSLAKRDLCTFSRPNCVVHGCMSIGRMRT